MQPITSVIWTTYLDFDNDSDQAIDNLERVREDIQGVPIITDKAA